MALAEGGSVREPILGTGSFMARAAEGLSLSLPRVGDEDPEGPETAMEMVVKEEEMLLREAEAETGRDEPPPLAPVPALLPVAKGTAR